MPALNPLRQLQDLELFLFINILIKLIKYQ